MKDQNTHRIIKSTEFSADKAWGSLDIASMNGITTRLHWTNEPYHWHVNEGEEVFAVLDGVVNMHYKQNQKIHIEMLNTGDVFYAGVGTEHVAHPVGEARILVIESEGSE